MGPLHGCQRPQQSQSRPPAGWRCPSRHPAPGYSSCPAPPACRAFSGSPTLDSNTARTRSWRINWARNTWSVLLAKGRSSISIPNATFQLSKSARVPASTLRESSSSAVASRLGTLSRPVGQWAKSESEYEAAGAPLHTPRIRSLSQHSLLSLIPRSITPGPGLLGRQVNGDALSQDRPRRSCIARCRDAD